MDRSPPPIFKQGPSSVARVGLFALLSLLLMAIDTRTAWLQALRQGVGAVLYPVQRTLLVPREALSMGSDYLGEIERLRTENTALRRVETANALQLLQAAQLAQENRQLRELLAARERLAVKTVVAEVLYDSRDPFSRKQVLDKGLQHGVRAGQPVMDARGVVGQITRVFPLSAEVTLLTDRGLTLPVQVQRTGLRAIAAGTSEAGLLELRYISVNADLKEDDRLVTSGLDRVYPAGLPVGTVSLVERSRSGNFARVLVRPDAGVEGSRLLLVLDVERRDDGAMKLY
jgi:rod shape-determining protein MreC